MGGPMATNLVRNSRRVLLYDKDMDKAQQLAKQLNMEVAENVQEVATRAKFVVTMLPESSHVEQVYLDKQNGMKTLSTIATA